MSVKWVQRVACGLAFASLSACGGGSDPASTGSPGTGSMPTPQTGTVSLMVSDAPAQDWALVGVRIESIALIPRDGGSNVTVYSVSAASAPYVNLVQLDQLSEILGNVQAPEGTYTGAVITVGGNPGDVLLTTSADPQSGFAGAPSTAIPSTDIQIQHTEGASGSRTVPITVTFDSPLTVTAGSSNALDLEFDLSHPAFILAHQPPGSGSLLWAVNFNGPVRHHPIADVTRLTLRHLYGTVASVATDGNSVTVNRDYRAWPITSRETAVQTSQSVTIDVDGQNGTLLYDVDAKSGPTRVTSFASIAGLASGRFLRIQARYQTGGTLVATRIWSSSTFAGVWGSPEGHVLDVNSTAGTLLVTSESGQWVTVGIDGNTSFYYHGGTTAIGTGAAFLRNVKRGFKVHVEVADPLAQPLLATAVDIETAGLSGAISGVSTAQLTLTHHYLLRTADDYTITLPYISASTPNGSDGAGNAITGFKFWPFAYPTELTSGSNAVSSFVQAMTGAPGLDIHGFTDAVWGDPADTNGWSAPWVGLLPSPVPLATVTSGFANGTLTLTTDGTAQTYAVDVGTSKGSATLVYQIDRTGGILTVSPVDLTTASGLASFTQALVVGTPIKVFGVPGTSGHLMGYVLVYYTGDTMPGQ